MINKIFSVARPVWNTAAAAFETQFLMICNCFLLLLIALLFTHCTSSKASNVSSDTNYASSDLVGTWQIQKYEVKTSDISMATEKLGKIKFQKNATGERHISYGFSDAIEYGSYPFTWTMQDEKLIINDTDTIFAERWEVVAIKKNWYKLKAPYKQDGEQIMEIKK